MPKTKFLAYLEAVFAVVVWGGTFIATKIALQEVLPATVVWIRFAIGVVILGAAVLARKQFAIPERNDLAYLALLGFIGFTDIGGIIVEPTLVRGPAALATAKDQARRLAAAM